MAPPRDEYLTPDEVLHRFPCLKTDFNWDNSTPGYLHSVGLLHGKYLKGRRMMLIQLDSLKRVIAYYKNELEITQKKLD
jgi:hypothetical protein